MKDLKLLKVGAVAKMLGVNERTIRRWEEAGWFCATLRSPGGKRLYAQVDVEAEILRMRLAAENKRRGVPMAPSWPAREDDHVSAPAARPHLPSEDFSGADRSIAPNESIPQADDRIERFRAEAGLEPTHGHVDAGEPFVGESGPRMTPDGSGPLEPNFPGWEK